MWSRTRNITLHPWIGIHQPSPADVAAHFKDLVRDKLLQLWEAVLDLVRHQETREASADGDDAQFARRVAILRI